MDDSSVKPVVRLANSDEVGGLPIKPTLRQRLRAFMHPRIARAELQPVVCDLEQKFDAWSSSRKLVLRDEDPSEGSPA